MSHSRRIDGLWVGYWVGDNKNPSAALDRVETALGLIKLYDPVRYRHLVRDLERIWVTLLPASRAQFRRALKMCVLDERYVLAETTQPEQIASTIVHEATHARLIGCGIGYQPEMRARVEAACFRRQRVFAARLPNGDQAREEAERRLTGYPSEFWTDASFDDRHEQGMVDGLRYLGASERLIRAALRLHALLRSSGNLVKRPNRRLRK
ncbi:MAG TPA: hypothetical protein VKQ73_02555 [Stellaceae bacterium]|nr:hypothetical protein [Stellaceae bacterium]